VQPEPGSQQGRPASLPCTAVPRPRYGLLGEFQQKVLAILAAATEPVTVREIAKSLGREDDSFRRQVRAAVDALEAKGLVRVYRKVVLGFSHGTNGPASTPFAGSLVELTEAGQTANHSDV
jgi:hypothetical protein